METTTASIPSTTTTTTPPAGPTPATPSSRSPLNLDKLRLKPWKPLKLTINTNISKQLEGVKLS